MDESCLFCKIIDRKIPSAIEFENDDVLVFNDINPQAPVHMLVIPKRHIADINSVKEGELELMGKMVDAARQVARQKNIGEGYRLVFNNGASAGQSVFHIHLHILGGRAMKWPPG